MLGQESHFGDFSAKVESKKQNWILMDSVLVLKNFKPGTWNIYKEELNIFLYKNGFLYIWIPYI